MKLLKLPNENKRYRISLVIIAAIVAVIVLLWPKSDSSFLHKYGKADHYMPMKDEGKGLIGKINAALAKALKDDTLVGHHNLFDKYPRLKFLTSIDSLPDFEFAYRDVRLINFIPTDDEKDFYYNSQFSKIIEEQKKHWGDAYFEISFSDDKKSIDSIKVDETRFYTSLSNNAWKGSIEFSDPTLQWDSARKFIVFNDSGIIVPLFTSTDTTDIGRTIDISPDSLYLSPARLIDDYLENNENQRLHINTNTPHVSFQIWQDHNNIITIAADAPGTSISYNNNNCRDTCRINSRLNNKDLPVTLKNGNASVTFIITEKSPYQLGSQVANGAYAGNVIPPNESYSDLFSAQIIHTLRQNIKDSSIKNLTLTYDALQAKYYEDIFKDSLIEKFNKNPKLSGDGIIYDINLTLIDLATGEIIAAPFYSNDFGKKMREDLINNKKNFNLSTQYEVGSIFKPLVAGASVINYPALLNYSFDDAYHFYKKDRIRLNGFDLKWSAKDEFKPCRDMSTFLAMSNSGYPTGLAVSAFVDNSDPMFNQLSNDNRPPPYDLTQCNQFLKYNRKGEQLGIRKISETYLAKTLETLLNIPILLNNKVDETNSYFQNLNIKRPWNLLPEASSLFGETQLNQPLDFNRELRTWVLGQGRLDISTFKICEAYARLISKRNIGLSYTSKNIAALIEQDQHTLNGLANPRSAIASWNSFLDKWYGAQNLKNYPYATFKEGKTAFDAATRYMRGRFPDLENLNVLFKTGTPSNQADSLKKIINGIRYMGKDDAWFMMAITNNHNEVTNNNARGIVMGVHVCRRKILTSNKEAKDFTSEAKPGFWGAILMKDFLTTDLISKIIWFNRSRFTEQN